MAWSEEDDEPQNFRSEDAARPARQPRPRDDSGDQGAPDHADLVPDEMPFIRCTHCKKLIFEDSLRCPYCKSLQLEEHQSKKPLWFFLTALLCLLFIAGYFLTSAFDFLRWIHR